MIGAITVPFHTSLSSCLWVALSEYAAHKVFTPFPCFPSFSSFFSCVIHFRRTSIPQAVDDTLPENNSKQTMVFKFTSIVRKFDVSLSQARYMFNVFLMPKLELALHYIHGPEARRLIRSCDSVLIGCIKPVSYT